MEKRTVTQEDIDKADKEMSKFIPITIDGKKWYPEELYIVDQKVAKISNGNLVVTDSNQFTFLSDVIDERNKKYAGRQYAVKKELEQLDEIAKQMTI